MGLNVGRRTSRPFWFVRNFFFLHFFRGRWDEGILIYKNVVPEADFHVLLYNRKDNIQIGMCVQQF